jgi:predicted RNA-binding Zn-ribbon protein involved in translation (DUF1610 family)
MHHRAAGAVPVARSPSGELVRPDEAESGMAYTCPGCGEAVLLRRGERRRAHFAHRRASCAPDSTLHRAAKAKVVEVVEAWRSGDGPRPCISRPCARVACGGGIVQDLPDDVTAARSEVRLASGLVGDVVLYRGPEPAVAVEILVTSRVTAERAARFGLPWVELDAREVLERPYWWVAVRDGLRPFSCPTCEASEGERRAEVDAIRGRAERLAQRAGLEVSTSPAYHPVSHRCWRCGSEIVVYVWRGGGRHSPEHPPEPIPATVRYRVTEGAGNYWANCCPACSAVQGDYYLAEGNTEYAVVQDAVEDPYGSSQE